MTGQPDPGETYRRYQSAVVLHAQAGARACGLGASDLHALTILALAGAMTPGELGARIGLTTGPTTRLVDRLEHAGYVRRVPDPSDRRKVTVQPTGEPADLDRKLTPARRRLAELIASYEPQEQRILLDYFARAAAALEQSATEIG
ncbi:MarR family transcriptional regulator [Nocardia sp. CDC159]|uniref:MarR family transcriptional regulator n=1 Tax=Nocardia pulmonis TaxID=2951408 RepID=A0A9X2ED44_9NOCA|nr:MULTISPECIES: MarR family transcriptional regulator [Nocardia]MCM6778146.1 MarR family transcriptional regulator [Nocardia pulmonis]MCM6791035.1 MarR family transcriptional regulator [Nocardia sp. CDC159]